MGLVYGRANIFLCRVYVELVWVSKVFIQRFREGSLDAFIIKTFPFSFSHNICIA